MPYFPTSLLSVYYGVDKHGFPYVLVFRDGTLLRLTQPEVDDYLLAIEDGATPGWILNHFAWLLHGERVRVLDFWGGHVLGWLDLTYSDLLAVQEAFLAKP